MFFCFFMSSSNILLMQFHLGFFMDFSVSFLYICCIQSNLSFCSHFALVWSLFFPDHPLQTLKQVGLHHSRLCLMLVDLDGMYLSIISIMCIFNSWGLYLTSCFVRISFYSNTKLKMMQICLQWLHDCCLFLLVVLPTYQVWELFHVYLPMHVLANQPQLYDKCSIISTLVGCQCSVYVCLPSFSFISLSLLISFLKSSSTIFYFSFCLFCKLPYRFKHLDTRLGSCRSFYCSSSCCFVGLVSVHLLYSDAIQTVLVTILHLNYLDYADGICCILYQIKGFQHIVH